MTRYRKAIASAVGSVVAFLAVLIGAINPDLLPDPWRPWLALLIGVLTTFGVYRVENASYEGRHEAS